MLFIQHPADIPGHSFDDFLINTYVFSGYIQGKLLLEILLHFLAGFKNRLRFFGAGEQDLPPVPGNRSSLQVTCCYQLIHMNRNQILFNVPEFTDLLGGT